MFDKEVFRATFFERAVTEEPDKEIPRLVVPRGVFRMDTLRTNAGACPATETTDGAFAVRAPVLSVKARNRSAALSSDMALHDHGWLTG